MYTPTIGLEIHAEMLTNSKLFCGCPNESTEKEPNTLICPICVGHPGTLPFITKKPIESILKMGIALDGDLADFTEFDRKHYFYPDIPKGYQISQHNHPLVQGGSLTDVRVTRIHLEEDTAKNIHNSSDDSSLIDFNRSGVPLMELVTEPDIHTADKAVEFANELQLLLQYLKVSNARMEWGEMRVEVNISLSKDNELGTKVEIKNLNSTKAVKQAIEYEIKRQSKLLDSKEEIVQETRGWNENLGKTVSQRQKESSHEYRYFPDPDIPKLYLSKLKWCDRAVLLKDFPELPDEIRKKCRDAYDLKSEDIEILIRNQNLYQLFTHAVDGNGSAQITANLLISDSIPLIEKYGEIFYKNVQPENLKELIKMYKNKEISSRGVKNILACMVKSGGSASDIAKKENLYQNSDETLVLEIAKKIISENQSVVDEIKQGNTSAIQFLIGQGMKHTKGSVNPVILRKIFIELIEG